MRSLVLGDSGGIGAAVAAALRDSGSEVIWLSRRDGLDLTDQDSVAQTPSRRL